MAEFKEWMFSICSCILKNKQNSIIFKNIKCGGPLNSAQNENKLFKTMHYYASDRLPWETVSSQLREVFI